MNRKQLEEHLNHVVEIELFDGTKEKGCLKSTNDEKLKRYPELYLKPNRYFVTLGKYFNIPMGSLFRVSHITKLRRIDK